MANRKKASDPGRASRFTDTGLRFLRLGDSICPDCAHLHDDGETCKAFPRGIPEDILIGKVKHTKPYPGDNGVQFQEK